MASSSSPQPAAITNLLGVRIENDIDPDKQEARAAMARKARGGDREIVPNEFERAMAGVNRRLLVWIYLDDTVAMKRQYEALQDYTRDAIDILSRRQDIYKTLGQLRQRHQIALGDMAALAPSQQNRTKKRK